MPTNSKAPRIPLYELAENELPSLLRALELYALVTFNTDLTFDAVQLILEPVCFL